MALCMCCRNMPVSQVRHIARIFMPSSIIHPREVPGTLASLGSVVMVPTEVPIFPGWSASVSFYNVCVCVFVGFKSHAELGSGVLVVVCCENPCIFFFIFDSHLGLILISATRGFALHPQGQIYWSIWQAGEQFVHLLSESLLLVQNCLAAAADLVDAPARRSTQRKCLWFIPEVNI